jgi:methionyl-tRNA formyltransferase
MGEKLNFLILGNSHSAELFAEGLISTGCSCVAAVSLAKDLLPDNSEGLKSWSEKSSINFREIRSVNDIEFNEIVESAEPDLLIVNWPRIINKSVLDLFRLGAIGSHPSQLPWGSGRHPLQWQIAMGIRNSCLSFFRLTPEVDKGPLLLQIPFEITSDDTISTVLSKIDQATFRGARELGLKLNKNQFEPLKLTDVSEGSTWRRRYPADVEIDCRMSINAIIRLVHSFIPPYPGAKLVTEFGSLIITSATKCDFKSWDLHQIGSVLRFTDKSLVLRVDDGPIKLEFQDQLSENFSKLQFVLPPRFYSTKDASE